MKKTLLFTALMLIAGITTAFAQSKKMLITKNDGTSISIKVSEIKDVTFPDDNALDIELTYNNFWLYTGQWAQFEATFYKNEEVYDVEDLTWTSTDENVAKVNYEGLVTAVGDGECDIIVNGDGSTAIVKINVTSEKQFDMTIDNIQNRSAHYTITPKNNDINYYYNLRVQSGDYSVDGMTQVGSEEQNMFQFTLDWWQFVADMYGMTWQEYMDGYELSTGTTDSDNEEQDALITDSQYCLYAFGMDPSGKMTTPVQVEKFTTTKPEASDLTFECSIDVVTSDFAQFTITPSNDNEPYFVNVQRGSYVEWFIEKDKLNDMASNLVDSFSPNVYPEAYCKGKVTRSTDDYLSSVRSDNDYYVIIFGWNDGQTTPVSLYKFHTK